MPQPGQADRDQRQAQHLPPREPAEGEIADLRVRQAPEFHREPEHPVQQREQARPRLARPRLARAPPQDAEHPQPPPPRPLEPPGAARTSTPPPAYPLHPPPRPA